MGGGGGNSKFTIQRKQDTRFLIHSTCNYYFLFFILLNYVTKYLYSQLKFYLNSRILSLILYSAVGIYEYIMFRRKFNYTQYTKENSKPSTSKIGEDVTTI